jgi:hypothetical protein
MRRFSRWALLVSCVCACSSPAPPIEEPRVAAAPAPGTPPAPSEPTPTADLPPRLEGPTSPVCQLFTDETIWPTILRRRPGAVAALDVDAHVAAAVSIPPGTMREGAFTELRGPTGVVRGWQDGADVQLHPAGSLVFGDFTVPQAYTRLQWKRADVRDGQSTLMLTFELDAHVKTRVEIEREAGCHDVRLTPGEFDVQAPLGEARYWGELAATIVPVSRAPGGPVIAELHIGPDEPQVVSVHEVQGTMARVVYYSFGQLVFGWVSEDMISRVPDQPSTGFGTGGGFGRGGRYGGHWVETICDRALPLLLWSTGEALVIIGELEPGTVFKAELHLPGGETPPWTTIQLVDDRWVQAAGENHLQVPSRLLTSCRSL